MKNISAENVTSSSIIVYEYLYGGSFSCVIYYAVIALILVIGPLLCTAIVLYEHFGADRHKRTLLNRLSSLIFINFALQSIIWSILRILRDTLGVLPSHLTTPILAISHNLSMSSLLFVTELTTIRYLYIVVWKRMKEINDEFWGFVLMVSTHTISTFFVLSTSLVGSHGYEMATIIDVTTESEQEGSIDSIIISSIENSIEEARYSTI